MAETLNLYGHSLGIFLLKEKIKKTFVLRYSEDGESSMTLSTGDNVKFENKLYKAGRGLFSRPQSMGS